MAWFWLYDDTASETYSLDDNVINLNIGGVNRNFNVEDFSGADGGYLRGLGNYSTNTITISKKNKLDSTSSTAWNAARNTLIKWLSKPKNNVLYLRIRNGENTKTVQTRIIPISKGDDTYANISITGTVSYSFQSLWGYFENTTASTDTLAITGSSEQSLEIINSGNIETPIECNFTPTGAETLFQVVLADSYGFRLEKTSFAAGVEIKYTTADGKLYFDDIEQKASQYLTGGSVFKIPTGTFNIYITCSGAGSFDYSYNERYI